MLAFPSSSVNLVLTPYVLKLGEKRISEPTIENSKVRSIVGPIVSLPVLFVGSVVFFPYFLFYSILLTLCSPLLTPYLFVASIEDRLLKNQDTINSARLVIVFILLLGELV